MIMKELDAIVAEVKEALAAKGKEIEAAGCCVIKPLTDAYLMRQKEVVSFERSTLNIMNDSAITPAMIASYRNDAHELLAMISKLRVS
jgi:hypothetical protein